MAKQNVAVQLYYDGAFNTVPAFVDEPVVISRGRGSEQPNIVPSTIGVKLDNREEEYDPEHPGSPLYGKIGRNSTVRILVAGEVRGVGEASTWDPDETIDFIPSGVRGKAWTTVEAAGVLRRLSQGNAPLRSPIYREMVRPDNLPYLLSYHPAETEASGSTRIASGIGGPPMQINTGSASFGQSTGVLGSSPLPVFAAGTRLYARVPASASTGTVAYRGVFELPSVMTDGRLAEIAVVGGSVARWVLLVTSLGLLRVQGWDSDGGVVEDGGAIGFDVRGHPSMIGFQVIQDGAAVDWGIFHRRIEGTDVTEVGFDGTFASATVGRPVDLSINAGGGITVDYAAGHHVVGNDLLLASGFDAALTGNAGEPAGMRVQRLLEEEGVLFFLPSGVTLDDSVPMGPQAAATLHDLLAECERTDYGIVFEPAATTGGRCGVSYRPGRNLYNRAASLTLDWSSNLIARPLKAIADDLASRNDVTASNRFGGEARAVLEAGPLSVQDPPDGIGITSTKVEVNAVHDDRLPGIAQWYLRHGTIGGKRFPQVTVISTDSPAGVSLMLAAAAVDIGHVIEIENLPARRSPDLARLVVYGITETVESHARQLTFTCGPASGFDVAEADDTATARADSLLTVLASDFDAGSDTSMSVTVSGLAWRTTAGGAALPFDIGVAGVRLTVTAIAGAGPGQTFTVTATPVNGIVKTLIAGERVSLWHPARAGL